MTHVLLLTLLLAPAQAGPARSLQDAKPEKLVKALDHKSGYAREIAARNLSGVEPFLGGKTRLRACVEDRQELGYVRAACAFTLSRWGDEDSVSRIVAAMEEVKSESRYWMAEALHVLDTRDARSHLRSLTSDADLYLSTSAREWTR